MHKIFISGTLLQSETIKYKNTNAIKSRIIKHYIIEYVFIECVVRDSAIHAICDLN